MTKYQNTSQQIGELGEAIFNLHAREKLNLIPNKVGSDYGIDFNCQIVGETIGSKRSIVAEFLMANVKSSSYPNPAATLEQSDLEFSLKTSQPLVFILVNVNTKEVYHRFLDEDLISMFFDRLMKGKKSFSLNSKIMSKDPDNFTEQLTLVNTRKYQNKLGLMKARLGLEKIIGKTRLDIHQTEDGSIAIVEVDQLENLFEKTHALFPHVRVSFLAHDLDKLELPRDAFKDFSANLDDIADHTSLVAPIHNDVVQLSLCRNGREVMSCNWEFRWFGDEMAYYHPSGLSLVFSQRRRGDDDHYHHHMEIIFSEKNANSLFEHPDIVLFLGRMRPGDTIKSSLSNAEFSFVDYWPDLLQITKIIKVIPNIYNKLDIEPIVQLRHLQERDIACTYLIINQFVQKTKSIIGFVVGNEDIDISVYRVMKTVMVCPFIVTLPEGQSLLKIKYDGEVLYSETPDQIVGVKSAKNPIVISCTPIEIPGFNGPALLVIPDKVAIIYSGYQEPESIKNPLNEGISFIN
ncbi:DUF4365 domain-containing protein [Paenibacillus sp. MMO-177]|uniref:DUF4365 domain-containing protein n=1 Tax=Paenibacillus sp. MMO-177 TaxID=3081289 RepID=UPI003019C609